MKQIEQEIIVEKVFVFPDIVELITLNLVFYNKHIFIRKVRDPGQNWGEYDRVIESRGECPVEYLKEYDALVECINKNQ